MARVGDRRCYWCGEPADDVDDLVPPEVLFDAGPDHNYKTPAIITVPSCKTHNADTSADDDGFAWVVSSAAILGASQAATVVNKHLLSKISGKRLWDRNFTDPRLAHLGVKIIRSASDCDANGNALTSLSGDTKLDDARAHVRDEIEASYRTVRKISAGLLFHATGAVESVGTRRTAAVHINGFKKILPNGEINPGPPPVEDAEFFSGFPPISQWQSVVSGSALVFQSRVVLLGKRRFGVRLLFYEPLHAMARFDGD